MERPPRLNLPPIDTPLRRNPAAAGAVEIFDPLRRKWVALTPEEWVRQHFVGFLIGYRGFPAAYIANEIGLRLNGTAKRCDTVVYDRTLRPLAIVEYKAPSIKLTTAVFDQIARYNSVLAAPCLIVSNGLSHHCLMRQENGEYRFVDDIPRYENLPGTARGQDTFQKK